MKQKFFKVFLFIAIIAVADKVIGGICKKLYVSSNNFLISKLRYTLDSTTEDILIYGSSRTDHHFIPKIIEQHTGHSAYNCGLDGADLLFSRIQLNETLKRYKPEFVIIEASPSSFFIPDPEAGHRILLPYYAKDTLIYNTLTGNRLFEKTKFLSSIYPYNSAIVSLVNGVLKKNTDSLKGYMPAHGIIDTTGLTKVVDKAYTSSNLPVENFTYLKQLIEVCRNNQIRVVIVSTPVFQVNGHHDSMMNLFKDFCSQFDGIHYLDFTRDVSTYGKITLFKDNTHMNDEGAKVFSEVFSENLREVMAPQSKLSSVRF
jgi:hypothetical protein